MATLIVGCEVQKSDLFGYICEQTIGAARAGLIEHAQAVIDTAWESMPVHGRREGDSDYETSPDGKPPYSHTETLRDALAYTIEGNYIYVGVPFSKVGVRGAVLEFGGRRDPVMSRNKSRRKDNNRKRHPFIQPAFDAQLDRLVPRVAGKQDSLAPSGAGGLT